MNRIKALRLENNMSQRDLAARVGCSQKSVDFWEKGLSEPTAGFVCRLADCFSCSSDYLLGREDDFGIVRIERDLNEAELQLLRAFSALPEPSRATLLEYAEFLAAKHKKG